MFEQDFPPPPFPPGTDMIGEILEGPKAAERMEFENFLSRLPGLAKVSLEEHLDSSRALRPLPCFALIVLPDKSWFSSSITFYPRQLILWAILSSDCNPFFFFFGYLVGSLPQCDNINHGNSELTKSENYF